MHHDFVDKRTIFALGRRSFFLLIALLFFCANSGSLRAQLDGVSEVGHSYQSDARGGTETAIGDTGLAHIRQPAATVTQPYGKFDSKITSIFIDNQWTDRIDKSSSDVFYTLAYNMGAIIPLDDRFGMGLAYETGGWQTGFSKRRSYQDTTFTMNDSFSYSKQAVYANFGMKVTDELFVGAGPQLHIIDLGMDLNSGPGVFKIPQSQAVGGGFQIGAIYQWTEIVRLGAAVASPTYFGGLDFGQVTYLAPGAAPVQGKLEMGAFTVPGRVSFGASAALTESLKVAAEGGYLSYGSSFFGGIDLRGLINRNLDLGFRDIWVLNTGLDYEFSEWFSGSVGYVYNTAPISPSAMVPIAAAIAQNQFTWGLRFRYGRFWTGFAHIFSLPASVDARANNHPELGASYQNSSVRQVLQSFNCGAGFQF